MSQLWQTKEVFSQTGGGKVAKKTNKKKKSWFGTSHEAMNRLPQT